MESEGTKVQQGAASEGQPKLQLVIRRIIMITGGITIPSLMSTDSPAFPHREKQTLQV
jgi:hypothetical protein